MITDLPTTWVAAPLSAICEINPRTKSELKPGDLVSFVPMAAVSEHSGSIVASETRPLEEVRKGFTPFQDGDVLFAKITPCMENGKAAIARGLVNGQGYGSTEFHVLRPASLVMAEWLFVIIRTAEFRRAAAASFQGAVGQQRVTADFLQRFRIPLPPLSEQQRIVDILQEAEEIRRLRAQAEAETAELIPALFASIFGDLYTGKTRFPVCLLSELGELDRGRSRHRPRDEPSLFDGPYPFLQTGDIAQSNGWVTSYSQTYSEKGLEQSRLWPKGTLAITIAANIGSTAILGFDACFPDSVVGFTPKAGVSAEYVRWWLMGYQKKLEIQAPQGAQKNINLEVLRAIRIPVPPTVLQQKFDAALENLREQIEANKKADNVFRFLSSSLSAHAFTGQLTEEWREKRQKRLASECRDRDAALQKAGVAHPLSRRATIQEMDRIWEDRTDGIYAELNREQRNLLSVIQRRGEEPTPYFTAVELANQVEGSLQKNPQAVESHLAVFAARGILIPVSREEHPPDTTLYVFGNAYRLPLEDRNDSLTTEEGVALITEEREPLVSETILGERRRVHELGRLVGRLDRGNRMS